MVRALELDALEFLLAPQAVIKTRARASVITVKIDLISFIIVSFIDMSQIG